jgi:hypothetical protein
MTERDLGGLTESDQYIDFAGTQGKYALLMVPDYDLDVDEKQASYVSYGASSIPDTSYSVWARFRGTAKGIRQHTDGELVTTTKGGRLEVVGGNFETHVRGPREPTAYDAASDDATKKTFRDSDQAYERLGLHPGSPHLPSFLDSDPAKKAEIERIVTTITTNAPSGAVSQFGWEDHTAGHRLSTTGGDKLEIVQGKSYIHVLGADDFDVSEGQKAIARSGSNPKAPGYDAAQNDAKRPMIVERTWARRQISETWLGVDRTSPDSKLPIDESIELTSFSDVIDGESREYTYGKKLSSWTGDADNWVDDVEEHTYAKRINSFTTVDASNEVMMAKGACAETTLVPFMTSTQVSVLLNEVYVGGHTAVEIGAGAELKIGAYFEMFVGKKDELEFEATTVTVGTSTKLTLVKKVEVSASDVQTSLEDLKTTLRSATIAVTEDTISGKTAITSASLRLGI